MKIQKIKLKNFRQFKDETFTFEDKINLIEGENGMGKSTFMSSIIFCVHGFEELKKSGLLESYDILYNISNIGKDSDRTTVITINIEIDSTGKQYEIKRTYDNRNKNIAGYNGELEVLEILPNKKVAVSHEVIEKLLPKELVPLLFFNGERITSINDVLNTGRQKQDFKNQIEGILQIKDYEKAKLLLNDVNREINNYRKEMGEDDLVTIREAIDTLENSKKRSKRNIVAVDDKINQLNEEIDKIDKFMEENKKSREIQLQLNQVKNNLRNTETEIINYENSFKKEIPKKINNDIKVSIFTQIIEEVEKGQSTAHQIPGVEKRAIEYILEEKRCLCDRKISVVEELHLEALKDSLPPENFNGYLKGYINGNDVENESLNLSLKRYNDLQIQRNKYNTKINELNDQLIEFDEEEIAEKKKEQFILQNRRNELFTEKTEYKTNFVRSELLLKEKQGMYENLIETQNTMDKYDLSQRYIEKSVELLSEKIKDKKDILQSQLQFQINEIAKKLVTDDLEIVIDKNLKPKVTFESGATDKSTGQNALISIAYLFALIEVTKMSNDELSNEGTNVNFPLILDGITAPLDEKHTYNAIENFYNYNGQVIFLTNSKEVRVVVENLKTAGEVKPENKLQLLTRDKNSNETKVVRR